MKTLALVFALLELPAVVALTVLVIVNGLEDSVAAAWEWREDHKALYAMYLVAALLLVRRRNRRRKAA